MFLSELQSVLAPYLISATGADVELVSATADSREVQPGWLFCAIKGAVTDGNRFVPNALAAGAAAILTDSAELVCDGVPVLRVRPGTGYQSVARVAETFAGYPAKQMRLVGITGTCGKTTTAFLTREILKAAGEPTGMIGTVVYDVGNGEEIPADRTTPTPFLLQELFSKMLKNGVKTVVMECSSAALDQERTGTAKFASTAFTNFSRDHLDYHSTMEAYLQAKKRLFFECLAPNGTAVINTDDPAGKGLAQELTGKCTLLPFGAKGPWKTALPGAFNRYNATCAGLLAQSMGVPDDVIAQVLATTAGAPGRLQRYNCKNGAVAFVDYAHTPEEITCALDALRPECPGRLGILFGCGGDRDRGKRPMMAKAASVADFVWLTSDNPRTEDPMAIIQDALAGIPQGYANLKVEADRASAIRSAVVACRPGDWLLIAGKGHEDYQEINHVKHPFSDWEQLQSL